MERLARPRHRPLPVHFEQFAASGVELDRIRLPIRLIFRDCFVDILEVSKTEFTLPHGERYKRYTVIVRVTDGEVSSRPFFIDCEDFKDFISKLRQEIMKFRIFRRLFREDAEAILGYRVSRM